MDWGIAVGIFISTALPPSWTHKAREMSCGHCPKRHRLQAVELSRRLHTTVQIGSKPAGPSYGPDLPFFVASWPCVPAGWLALFLIEAGDVETNPGPTTTHKQIWIFDICHKQIHGRRQISIWGNRIEHWVHLSCASIRLAQYTDTWTIYTYNPDSQLTQT